MPSEEEAKKLVKMIEEKRLVIQLGLGFAQLEGGVKAKGAAIMGKLLGKAKFAQQGDEVTVKATLDEGSSVAELLMTLPAMNR